MLCTESQHVKNVQVDMPQPHGSRHLALKALLQERRQDIIPATTYGVDRYSHPWMAADPSFARLLDATDRHEHIFALHRSYYASFGATDILGVSDPAAIEQRSYRIEGAFERTRQAYIVERGYGDNILYGQCHGLGLMECEHPWMETNSEYVLQENYTFQVDSFLYTPQYGARWEDGVRVTVDGVEQFSTYRREIIVI